MLTVFFPTAYAVYFDHKRRTDPQFRKALKRESKRQAKAAKEAREANGADGEEQDRMDVDERPVPAITEEERRLVEEDASCMCFILEIPLILIASRHVL